MPSLNMGWRTCSELAVRTARWFSWNLQHALLERQAAVVEQAAHFGLGVLDHVFVEHAVHAARAAPRRNAP